MTETPKDKKEPSPAGQKKPVPATFPPDMKFKWPWRPYQATVLEQLKGHLQDGKLHVVAAPGSGKTVLGLEVTRQLNKPSLVLAPSIAIKDQWADRLVDSFSTTADLSSLVSRDIKTPGFFTVSTFQGLHVAFTGARDVEDEEEDKEETAEEEDETLPDGAKVAKTEKKPAKKGKVNIIAKLKEAGVGTVVLDECHHLRAAWWKSLKSVVDGLGAPTTLALTATPPYDVEPTEWERYVELCGPIDAEINVPELVKVDNLCPHQDYVFFSQPTDEEIEEIRRFEKNIDDFLKKLFASSDFTSFIEKHPWVAKSQDNVEAILDNPELFSSMLVYLQHAGVTIPPAAISLVSGSGQANIPKISNKWMEVLLSGIFGDPEGEGKLPAPIETLRKDLARTGAIEQRKVALNLNEKIAKLLASSISKLRSIEDIVRAEKDGMGDKLRLVVLTDYIRKNMVPASAETLTPLNKIGIVPIFETLRRAQLDGVSIAALSGTFIVVPKAAIDIVKKCAQDLKVNEKQLSFKDLPYDPAYATLDFSGPAEARKVSIITNTFIKGGFNVLIGTKSLLGEGWDAPVTNSLILATFVGSFMFSNQMRGRAIRTEKNNPEKTGNIWHLCCVLPDSTTPGDDYATLNRRFKSFVGVAQGIPSIENGVNRLGIPEPPFSKDTLQKINEKTVNAAKDRVGMKKSWQKSLEKGGDNAKLVEKIVAREDPKQKEFVTSRAVKEMDKVGEVVLRALCGTDIIKSKYTDLEVKVQKNGNEKSCYLDGGTRMEQSIFIEALKQVIDPPRNPKYLLINAKGKKLLMDEIFTVPEQIGAKKDWAEWYSSQWKKYVSDNDLVYTRTQDGRLLLLKARNEAAYKERGSDIEILSKWQ